MRHFLPRVCVALSCALLPALAPGNGFFVPQQGVPGIGRANAGGAAGASDPSTMFFNPAGLPRLWAPGAPDRTLAAFNLHAIVPVFDLGDRGTFATTPGSGGAAVAVGGNDGGNPGRISPVPSVYLARPLSQRVFAGVAITSPYGLGAKYRSGWFGRYDTLEASLLTLNVAPTFAVKWSDRFSIGAGLDLQYADAKLTNAVPDTLAPGGPGPASDGLFELEGEAVTVGFNAGALIELIEDTTWLGVHYRSKMDHRLDGDATTSRLRGPLAVLNGRLPMTAELRLPRIVTVGVRHRATQDVSLLAEVGWFQWSRLDELRVRFDGGLPDAVRPTRYRDSYTVGGALEYSGVPDWVLRTGIQYDRTPTRDGFRDASFPDGDRLWLAAGATYRLSDDVQLDLALAHVPFADVDIAVNRGFLTGTPLAGTVNFRARSQAHVTTIAAGLRVRF